MRIFGGECRKLWGNRQALMGLLLLLAITVGITYLDVQERQKHENSSDIAAAYAQLEGMDPQEALRYMGLAEADEALLSRLSGGWQDWYEKEQLWPASVIRRVCRLAGIPGYIEETIQEAEKKTSISIFAVKGFEKKNLLRTKTVYQQLRGTAHTGGKSYGDGIIAGDRYDRSSGGGLQYSASGDLTGKGEGQRSFTALYCL